jgi:hypothetical protein
MKERPRITKRSKGNENDRTVSLILDIKIFLYLIEEKMK